MILNLSDFLPLLSAFTNLKRQYEIKFKEIRKVFYMFMFPNQKGIKYRKTVLHTNDFIIFHVLKMGFRNPRTLKSFQILWKLNGILFIGTFFRADSLKTIL